jgi:hypothetical protein
MKKLTLIIGLITFNLLTSAQDLTQYKDFFISKIPEYKEWLKQSNLGHVLSFDTIKVKTDKVHLRLKVHDKKQNKICDKANYLALNDTIEKQYDKTVSYILFEKLIFLMDLNKEQIEINIDSKDAFIDIWNENSRLIVDIVSKMGEVADGYRIEIKEIKGLNKTSCTKTNGTINAIKNKLGKKLEKEYEQYEAFFEDYDFDIVSRLGNELIIEINNVVKLIIVDESYFEHIEIKFEFTEEDSVVKIDYLIRAKYGAGIIWAPKSSDYYDVSPKYQNELEKFSIKFKNKIDKILKH